MHFSSQLQSTDELNAVYGVFIQCHRAVCHMVNTGLMVGSIAEYVTLIANQ